MFSPKTNHPNNSNIKIEHKVPSYIQKTNSTYEKNFVIKKNVHQPLNIGNDSVGMFFIGSITVVGLFVVYRMMEKYNR